MLQRRKEIVDVGREFLRADAGADGQVCPLAVNRGERRGKLPVAAVKDEHAGARAEAQHVDEIVRRLRRQNKRTALGEIVGEAEAGRREIRAGHGQT